jgi:hypothetical protein
MAALGVSVNDLFAFALPRMATIQEPRNVHFTARARRSWSNRWQRPSRGSSITW